MAEVGLSFSPANQPIGAGSDQTSGRGPINPVQDAIRLLSFRLPTIVGAGAPAPQALLSGPTALGAQIGGNPLIAQWLRALFQGQPLPSLGAGGEGPQGPQERYGLGAAFGGAAGGAPNSPFSAASNISLAPPAYFKLGSNPGAPGEPWRPPPPRYPDLPPPIEVPPPPAAPDASLRTDQYGNPLSDYNLTWAPNAFGTSF